MKTNKFFAIFLPIVCCFALCACSSVNMGVYIYNDGSIMQTYEVSIDKNELGTIGIDADALINKIDEVIETQWQNASNGKDLINIKFEVDKSSYQRIVKIKFLTFDAYANFYDINTSTDTEPNIKKGLFFNKKIIQDRNTTYSTINTTNLYGEISTFLLNNYFDGNVSNMLSFTKNVQTNTTFVYPSSLNTKSNATYKQHTGNYDVYVWQSNLAKDMSENPQKIEVWQTQFTTENRIAWYGTAIIASIVFGIVLFVVLYAKQKRKKETQNPNDEPLKTTNDPIFVEIEKNQDETKDN